MQQITWIAVSIVFAAALPLSAQDPLRQTIPGQDPNSTFANLPLQQIGPEDLLAIQVYDAPEFTRTVRVGSDGTIRLPLMKTPLRVQGLYPNEIEVLLKEALQREELFVDPFVTVNAAEYHSRPISVSGAVKIPTIFQAIGNVTLLDALARAGGLVSDVAGNEIVVTRPNADGAPMVERIPARALFAGTDPELNLKLTGGEEIRVPEVGKIVVAGNVNKPGVYPVLDPAETNTVMTAIAQALGLAQYYSGTAYIYRADDTGVQHEIMVELGKIKNRKKPDVALQAHDVLYIPDSSGKRMSGTALQALTGMSTAAASAVIYTTR